MIRFGSLGLEWTLSAITEPVRRIELFTRAGRRQTWSAQDKARIVGETLQEGETVCGAAVRAVGAATVRVATASTSIGRGHQERGAALRAGSCRDGSSHKSAPAQADRAREISSLIEVEISGVTVRIGRGADTKTVAAALNRKNALFAGTDAGGEH